MIGGWTLELGTWERLTPDQQGRVLSVVAECGGEWALNGHLAFRDHPEAVRCVDILSSQAGLPPATIEWEG